MDIQVLALPQPLSMAITLVSVFILYLILRKFLYNPVTNFLEDRKEKISSQLEEAEVVRNQALKLKEDYEEKMAGASREGQDIMEQARQRATEIKAGILEEAKEEANDIRKRAKKDIELEKEKAYQDVKSSVGEMAILIASKIMEKDMTMENQNQLIDKFIDEVGSSQWQN
jgi:F-type H+-transporting ATPase subunit b